MRATDSINLVMAGLSVATSVTPHLLVVHMLAAVGEDERKRIADRTCEALKAAKVKGIKLGNPRWQDSIAAARIVRSTKAARQATMVRPMIEGLRASGITTLSGLADALNERGIQTPQGRRWHPMTVKRVGVITRRSVSPGQHSTSNSR